MRVRYALAIVGFFGAGAVITAGAAVSPSEPAPPPREKLPLAEAYAAAYRAAVPPDARATPTGFGRVPWIILDAPADRLAAAYAPEIVAFAKAKLAEPNPEPVLPLLVLAKSAGDPAVAAYLLGDASELRATPRVLVVSYFPPSVRKDALVKLLRAEPGSTFPTDDLLGLAAAVGDADTLKLLTELVPGRAAWADAYSPAVNALRARAALPTPAAREARAAEELRFWQALAVPLRRDLHATDDQPLWLAESFRQAGISFSSDFLHGKIALPAPNRRTSRDLVAARLAAAVAGVQKETSLIDDLTTAASEVWVARWALGRMGTDSSLRALESLIFPGENRSAVNRHAAIVLAQFGNAKSIDALARARANPKFSAAELREFEISQAKLVERLTVPDGKSNSAATVFDRALARAVGVEDPKQAAAAQVAFLAIGKPAEELAAALGPGGVPELTARLTKAANGSAEWKLAALTLAHLSADPAARRTLIGGETIPGGLITVSFMPPDVRRQVLADLLGGKTAVPSDEVAELLAAVGDQDSRDRLRKFLEMPDVSPDRRPRIERAAGTLDRRLKLPTAAERDALAKDELLFWRVVAEPAPDRGVAEPRHLPSLADRPMRNAAELGRLKMSLSVPFLRAKLEQFGPAPATPLLVRQRIRVEVEFAAAIAGVQRVAELVPELTRAGTASGTDGQPARRALGMIGTDKSLRALETLPGPEWDGLSQDVAEVLAEYGDRASVAVLTRLATDARYTEATRRAFAAAQVRLEKRLSGVKPADPPGPPGAAKRP